MNAQLQHYGANLEPWVGFEPGETYYKRRLDEASNSGMSVLDGQSPAHFFHWVNTPDDDESTAALDFGKAFHCATLEPDVFAATYTILPADAPQRPTRAMLEAKGKRTAGSEERIAWWAAWDADNAGRILLAAKDYDKVQFMGESIRRHPIAAAMIQAGKRELTMRWTDEQSGVRCKARLDLYDEELAFNLDLKKTRDASPEGFARSVHRYRYHVQHAHYSDGARTCGLRARHFLFLACEDFPPYVCVPYHIDAHAEERGFEIRDRSLAKHAQCLRTGQWPGYGDTIRELSLPAFAFYD